LNQFDESHYNTSILNFIKNLNIQIISLKNSLK
jgi:hypothetical protein